jgi:hypothetical protein
MNDQGLIVQYDKIGERATYIDPDERQGAHLRSLSFRDGLLKFNLPL